MFLFSKKHNSGNLHLLKELNIPCFWDQTNRRKQDKQAKGESKHLLYILQPAGVRFQWSSVLDHFVHGYDQEDEIQLWKQTNRNIVLSDCNTFHEKNTIGVRC